MHTHTLAHTHTHTYSYSRTHTHSQAIFTNPFHSLLLLCRSVYFGPVWPRYLSSLMFYLCLFFFFFVRSSARSGRVKTSGASLTPSRWLESDSRWWWQQGECVCVCVSVHLHHRHLVPRHKTNPCVSVCFLFSGVWSLYMELSGNHQTCTAEFSQIY